MFTEKQNIEILKALRNKKNVKSWALGKKYTNGRDTNQNAILVFVTKKEDVNEENTIPAEIAGMVTDIIEQNDKVYNMTVNPDYSYSYCTNCNAAMYSDSSCNCTQCDGDDCPNPCLTNRVAQIYDNVFHNNYNGRILQGGLSALGHGFSGSPCNIPQQGKCTFSLVAVDNTDNKLVLLCNQHCLTPYGIIPNSYIPSMAANTTFTNFLLYQNVRINTTDVNSIINSTTYINPSTDDGCSNSTVREVGEFKASVFLPRSIYFLNPNGNPGPLAYINIEPLNLLGDPIDAGIYNMTQYYDTYTANGELIERGLTCLQRQWINDNYNNYSITLVSNSNISISKVLECAYSDSAIFRPYVTTPLETTIIPLPGIHDLGEGPFEWITKDEFYDLVNDSQIYDFPIYIYKSGARRGVQTVFEQYKYFAGPDLQAEINLTDTETMVYGDTIRCVPDGANTVMHGPGDSGSPVLVEHDSKLKVIGLLTWGGCYPAPPPGSNYSNGCLNGTCYVITICPIWRIAEDLNIRAWDGSIIVDSDDETITVAGRPYRKTIPTTQPITHYKD